MKSHVEERESTPSPEIPVVEPSAIPQTVDARRDDWRKRYDELREQYPYFRVGDEPTVWFTRYQAARSIMTDFSTFSSVGTSPMYLLPSSEDPPLSNVFRGALLPQYSAQKVAEWEPRIRQISRDIIGRFAERGSCDFVTEFAQYYFPYIGADWMGAPREDWDRLVQWEHDVFNVPEDGGQKLLEMQGQAMFSLMEYVDWLLEEKRKNPDDRLVSFVLGLEVEGRRITLEEAKAAVLLACLGSGHTVTSHLGYLFKFFAERPEVQQKVVDDPASIDRVGEEVLREYSLFGHDRIVQKDTELDGCPLKAGDKVFVMYTMANRDPRCEGWDHVDIDREPNRHMAFNMGAHRCLGIHWARGARRIAVEEWHAAIPKYRLDESVRLVEQVYAGVGYHHLPLLWEA